jgi:hypothetical protein
MDGLLAGATAALHAAFLVYVALGGFPAWRWPRTAVLHLAAVAWGVLSLAAGVPCPLTAWENAFRARAGWPPLAPGGFIDTYLEGALYPDRYTPLVLAVAGLLVLVSWVGLFRRGRAAGDRPSTVRTARGLGRPADPAG